MPRSATGTRRPIAQPGREPSAVVGSWAAHPHALPARRHQVLTKPMASGMDDGNRRVPDQAPLARYGECVTDDNAVKRQGGIGKLLGRLSGTEGRFYRR